MTKVKICGISRPEDVEALNEAAVDFAGFIFAPKSPRKVTFERAKDLKAKLNKDIQTVGVFVDEEIETIVQYTQNGAFDIIQLHGRENDNYIKTLKSQLKNPVIKALKAECDIEKAQNCPADYILFDANTPGLGKTFDWSLIKGVERPFFLAGGLNADNVLEAIAQLNPWVLDINSGVETDSIKDYGKIIEVTRKIKSAN